MCNSVMHPCVRRGVLCFARDGKYMKVRSVCNKSVKPANPKSKSDKNLFQQQFRQASSQTKVTPVKLNQLLLVGGLGTGLAGILAYYFKVVEPRRYGLVPDESPPKPVEALTLTSATSIDEDKTEATRSARHPQAKVNYPDYDSMPDIPGHVQYLMVGGGTAAAAAFRGIRSKDPRAQVLVIGEEEFNPYMRTPLSKEVWYMDDDDIATSLKFTQWNGSTRSIFHHPDSYYCKPKELAYQENGGVAVVKSTKVVKIDPLERKVTLDNGWEVYYDRCLLATGGTPRNLGVMQRAGAEVEARTTLFRGIKDFQRLDALSRDKDTRSVAIIGGGFLGSELACALAYRSQYFAKTKKGGNFRVIQMFPEAGNMGRVLPEYLCKWTTNKIREDGVNVIPNVTVEDAAMKDGQVALTLSDGKEVLADHVVVAVGLEPNTQLAAASGLELDSVHGGVKVNAELAARSNVWVAGDVASFFDIKLRRRRVEHHDHAVVSGRLAGENMTGAGKPYWHQSMFWSDLGADISYEAIGIVDSSLPTVAAFAKDGGKKSKSGEVSGEGGAEESPRPVLAPAGMEENYKKGVVFYVRDKVVVGVVMWNVFRGSRAARKIIMDGGERTDAEIMELAKLFDLYGNSESS